MIILKSQNSIMYLFAILFFSSFVKGQSNIIVNDSTIIEAVLKDGSEYYEREIDLERLMYSRKVKEDTKLYLYGFNTKYSYFEGYINKLPILISISNIKDLDENHKKYLIEDSGNKQFRKEQAKKYANKNNISEVIIDTISENKEENINISLDSIKYFFLPLKTTDNYVHSEIASYCYGSGKSDYIDNGVYTIMNFKECRDYSGKLKRFIKISAKGNPYFIEYKADFQFYTKGQQKVSYIEAKNYIENLDDNQRKALDKLLLDHSYQSYLPQLVKIEDRVNFSREKGIAVLDYNAIESEYYGTGAKFKVLNFSDKPIKKIYVTFYGTNKGKQKVYFSKDKLNATKLLTELLEPYNTIEIEFDKIWNTNSVEYINIKSFKIIYLDDKEVTIPFNDNLYISEDKMNEYLDFLKK